MIAYLYFAHTTWSQVLAQYLGAAFAGQNALLVSTILFFMTAYVAGQFLSPFAKGGSTYCRMEVLQMEKGAKEVQMEDGAKEESSIGSV